MGQLIPQNINLWMGNSTIPSTSGLHHDYHDNLYILMRGNKSIDLYSFEDIASLYTVGDLERVHPNGRINYRGQPTRADGSHVLSEKALAASSAVQCAAAKLDEVIFYANPCLAYVHALNEIYMKFLKERRGCISR
jgi:hypothetical protein